MKKIFVLVITFLVIGLVTVSAMGSQDSIENDSGNAPAVITQQRPNAPAVNAQQRPVVAIALFFPFNGCTPEEALRVKQAFSALLGKTGLVDIKNQAFVDKTLIEHNLHSGTASGWADARKKEAFGRALNASWIVQGTVQRLGDKLFVDLSFYDQTFTFVDDTHAIFPPTDDPIAHIQPLVDSLVDAISRGAKPYIELKSYKVGDIGPAGGIIFFINGNTKDGWRYLEATPYDLGPAAWGAYGRVALAGAYTYYGEDKALGRGRLNTETIVENLNRAGEKKCAAQLCAGFELNGFKDWFLPSIDELREMYGWLIDSNVGGHKDTFQHDSYWSSSEVNELHGYLEGFKGEWAGAIFNNMDKIAKRGVRPIRAF